MENTKGKKNKLKINDKVEISSNCVAWFANHLVDNYSIKFDSYYGREIELKNLNEIHGWITAFLSKKNPIGKVVGYGSEDEFKGYNCIRVETKFKHGKISSYLSEKDLKKIK